MTIGYKEGCKCAYCKKNVASKECEHDEKRYMIVDSHLLGATWKYQEYIIHIPMCKECCEKRDKAQLPFAWTGCLIFLVPIGIAGYLAFQQEDTFGYALIQWAFWCIPAFLIGVIPMFILNFIGERLADKRTYKIDYDVLNVFDKYHFLKQRPSRQTIHESWWTDEMQANFITDLNEAEAKWQKL